MIGKRKPELVNIVVGVVEITAMIDSSASCNIVDKNTWGEVKKKKMKCTSSKATGRCLYAYGNEKPLTVLGTFEAEATLSGGLTEAKLLLSLLSLTGKVFHCLGGKLQKSWGF